jgi:hypothetical protein
LPSRIASLCAIFFVFQAIVFFVLYTTGELAFDGFHFIFLKGGFVCDLENFDFFHFEESLCLQLSPKSGSIVSAIFISNEFLALLIDQVIAGA